MTGGLTWAIRPKWHRLESPHSYARRQCDAAGIPLYFAERGLTTPTQPYVNRVWAHEATAAAIVEAAAGRPPGHYLRLRARAQPDPTLTYPERFLCRLCAAGEHVEQLRHDRENWCLRHPGQLVWAGPGTTPESQPTIPYDLVQAKAERRFRRLVAAGLVDSRLHTRAWEMVRDNASLTSPDGCTEALSQLPDDREIGGRAALYPQTVDILKVLSNPATIERWRAQSPARLRDDIIGNLPTAYGPVDVLVERIVLWLRPLRRETQPTRIDPLNVPLDLVDTAAILDTAAPYPAWIQRHPRAIAEWDWARNDATRDPWSLTGASRTAWWVCDQGHSWTTSPSVRGAAGSNCPYCVGQEVWPGHTDFGTLHPDVAGEWDNAPGVNQGDPGHVSATSARRITWRCHAGHRWVAPIRDRSQLGYGCPYCAGRRVIPGETDLATLRPDVAAEWHPELNGELSPDVVPRGSRKKAWWKGACGHSWQAIIASRTRNGHGCPYCTNQAVLPGFNDLATTHPELAAQWHADNSRTEHQVPAGSSYRAVWKCSLDHVWTAVVANRTSHGTGCPYCSNYAVLAGFNDLATVSPQLAKEWDTTIGANDRTTSDVAPGSDFSAGWKCDRGHTWRATVGRRNAGSGCPYCTRRRILPGETDLATLRPDLAAEWDISNELTSEQVTPMSRRKVAWRCEKGHVWRAWIGNRSNGSGCPHCAGQIAADFILVCPESTAIRSNR